MKTGYLNTAEVARMLKVNDSTVKRWTDAGTLKCMKTPGGHRKYRTKDVVEFMDAFKYDTTETLVPAQKTFAKVTVSTDYAILMKDFSVLSNLFYNTVLEGNRENTFQFLSLLYANRISLADICDKIIFPAFTLIGEKWMMREIAIEQEHLASNTTIHALYRLQDTIHKKNKNGFVVLSGCLENEYHELGIMCATNVLEAAGWSVYSLGANVPTDSFVNAIETHSPQLIVVSSTTPKTKKSLIDSTIVLHNTAKQFGAKFVVGGYAAQDKIKHKLSADYIPNGMNDLLQYANTLVGKQ